MNIKTLIQSSMLAATLFTATSMVQADDRITLGRTVLLKSGNLPATVPLIACRKATGIKIKATRDLHLKHIVVKFKNGGNKKIIFNLNMKEDQETRWRPFMYQRCVKSIHVYGNSVSSSAGIKVYGKKNNT